VGVLDLCHLLRSLRFSAMSCLIWRGILSLSGFILCRGGVAVHVAPWIRLVA